MFALVNLDADGKAVISYSAGPERYSELLEAEGIIPAPYMARIYWVAVERWDVFRLTEWETETQRSPHHSPSTNSRLKPAPPWPYRPPSKTAHRQPQKNSRRKGCCENSLKQLVCVCRCRIQLSCEITLARSDFAHPDNPESSHESCASPQQVRRSLSMRLRSSTSSSCERDSSVDAALDRSPSAS